MFQKYMQDNFIINSYDSFDKNIFSKYQCGFRKRFSTQQALLAVLEKMKISRDRKGFCAAVLTDYLKLLTVSVMISSFPS